ncbi:MAG: PxxKW family cysteine-rich protein [Myxococcales bacterium]|nr:PxxKW family cysteine-rich protein [Myxococcales bacterium]
MSNIVPADQQLIATLTANGFQTVHTECDGCGHIRGYEGSSYCKSYKTPAAKWTLGMCNFATHKRIEKTAEARSLNPLKASKRGGN